MQELAHQIFIETTYAGVTLGAINWSHGLILIDAPFRAEDARSWRSALLSLSGGVDRMLINLDAHFDRTLGARTMECTVIGHEKVAEVFRTRPTTFKTQGNETGAEWELYNGLGSIRWLPPDITFSEGMVIHWDESPLCLEQHPGPSIGAIWAVLPEQHIVFVGDTVVPDQPPFLASADLPAWIELTRLLTTPLYQNYLIVSGRNGLVAQQQVHKQLLFLEKANQMIEQLAARKAQPLEMEGLINPLLNDFDFQAQREAQFRQRLRYGLMHYYAHHYESNSADISEE